MREKPLGITRWWIFKDNDNDTPNVAVKWPHCLRGHYEEEDEIQDLERIMSALGGSRFLLGIKEN